MTKRNETTAALAMVSDIATVRKQVWPFPCTLLSTMQNYLLSNQALGAFESRAAAATALRACELSSVSQSV